MVEEVLKEGKKDAFTISKFSSVQDYSDYLIKICEIQV